MITKIIRNHRYPRSRKFIPTEADNVPVDPITLLDKRVTIMRGLGKKSERVEIRDQWRRRGNNLDRRKERWTGKTIFYAMTHPPKGREQITRHGACVAICSGAQGLKTIPLNNMFVPARVTIRVTYIAENAEGGRVHVRLHRRSGVMKSFVFRPTGGDRKDVGIEIDLHELDEHDSAFVLMCAEDDNRFERYMSAQKYCHHIPVLITADDDLLSPYGIAKWRAALRTSRDACMFAGPCTAGSPWSRLNASKSKETEIMLTLKQVTYWKLWEQFHEAYLTCIKRGSPLLFELPRHCDYWKDDRIIRLMDDGMCQVHELDGCMFGLAAKNGTPIKKPWKMLSWNTRLGNGLNRKCDGSHEHTPCAGSETKSTQLYTPMIVKLIVDSITLPVSEVGRLREGTLGKARKSTKAACCVSSGHWLDEDSDDDAASLVIIESHAAAQNLPRHDSPADPRGIARQPQLSEPRTPGASRKQEHFFYKWVTTLVLMSVGAVLGGGVLQPWKGKMAAMYPTVERLLRETTGAIGSLPKKIDCTEPWLDFEQMTCWGAKGLPAALLVAARWAQTQREDLGKNDLLAMLEMINPFMNEEEDNENLKSIIERCNRGVTAFFIKAKADVDKVRSGEIAETAIMKYVMDKNVIERLKALWDGVSATAENHGVRPAEVTMRQAIAQLRDGKEVNERNTVAGRIRNVEYYFCMRSYYAMTMRVIDWRNVRDIVNYGITALREFLIGAAYCLHVGTWKGRTDVDQFDFLNLLGDDNLDHPVDLAGIRNSLEILGVCIHGTLYYDSVLAEGFIPSIERRRAGCKVLFDAVEKYTIFETDVFRSMYGLRERDPNGAARRSFRGVLIDSYTRYKKSVNASGPEGLEYEIRRIESYPTGGDVPVLLGFDATPINTVPKWYMELRASTGGRRWAAPERGGEATTGPPTVEPKARPKPSSAPRPPEQWMMGHAKDATTQIHEMKGKGMRKHAVEFNAHQGYPMRWHQEGPMTIDKSVGRPAILARKLLYFMLQWLGGKPRRSIDRTVGDVLKDDETIASMYEDVRTTSTMSAITQFIPTGAELLVMMDLDKRWVDNTSGGMNAKRAMKEAFSALSVPESAMAAVLTGGEPNILTEESASVARGGGATIVVTDLDYRWSSKSGGTKYDLRYYLGETSWPKTEVIIIPQGEYKDSAGDRLVKAIREARKIAADRRAHGTDVSMHIWLSGSFALETEANANPNNAKQSMSTMDPFLETTAIGLIAEIQRDMLGRPAMIRLNLNTWEFLNRGNHVVSPHEFSPPWIMGLRSRFKSIGCLISTEMTFWEEIYAAAGWSPFHRSTYSGPFAGVGAGLQLFAVMEKYLLREKILDSLYYDPSALQNVREQFNDALSWKQIDGKKLEDILHRSGGIGDGAQDNFGDVDADIDWTEFRDNPAAFGKSSLSFLPRWQRHDPRSYGFLNPKQREHRRSVCAGCLELIETGIDLYAKTTPVSNICVRCCGIEQFEATSSYAVDGKWSAASLQEVNIGYEKAFGIIVNVFNLMNPTESELVKAMPTRENGDILPVLKVIWSTIGSTRGIRKMLSHYGAIRIPQHEALREIAEGNLNRFHVDMQEYNSIDGGNISWRYRILYDVGNVAYATWLQNIVGRDSLRIYTSSTSPSAEACGDLVEAAIGVFEVLSAFVHVPCVRPMLPLNNVRMGIEQSILGFLTIGPQSSEFENTKGKTRGAVSKEDHDRAVETLHSLGDPCMNPCIRGALEFITDEIEPIIIGTDDEFSEEEVVEEVPDYGDGACEASMDIEMKSSDELDNARRETVESLDEVLSKLQSVIPCFRCGSSEHSVLECTVGGTVREIANDFKRVLEEKHYTVGEGKGTRGSSGEAHPKRHRRSDIGTPENPEPDRNEEVLNDERILLERHVMETEAIRLSEISVDIHKPELLTDDSGREYADLYDRKYASRWVLQKLVVSEYETSPGTYRISSEALGKELEQWKRNPDQRFNRCEGPITPRFDVSWGLYHIEIFKPQSGKLMMFSPMQDPQAEISYQLPPQLDAYGDTRSPDGDGGHRMRIDKVSRNLSLFLRHRAGRPLRTGDSVRRDDGMWVSWMDALHQDWIWEDRSVYARDSDKERRKFIELRRAHTMCCCILRTEKEQGKSRIHIMATKIIPTLHRNGDDETLRFKESLINMGVMSTFDQGDLTEYDGMIAFDRIRATSAWSEERRGSEESILDMNKMSIRMTPSLAEKIPIAFHMTTMKSLRGIAESGLLPGGKRRTRNCTFFSAFPPFGRLQRESTVKWDFSNTIVLGNDIMSGLLLLTIPTSVLRGAYDGRVDLDGHMVTSRVIPFHAFETAWYGLWNNKKGSMEWRRILISREERRDSPKIVTGILEDRKRAPHDPKWGDLANRAYEAVKLEDSDLDIGRVDRLVQLLPESRRKSDLREGAWSALHGYISVHLPLDYEQQICPNCVAWVSSRLNVCCECYAEFTSSREAHPMSSWYDRDSARRRRTIEKMRAEAKAREDVGECVNDEQGDQPMEPTVEEDDYLSKLKEMMTGAMEEDDDLEGGGIHGEPSESQRRAGETSQDPIGIYSYTFEDINRFSKAGEDANYEEIVRDLGEEAAKKGFQATGAYYPDRGNALDGTAAYCRNVKSPCPGSWIVGDEILDNRDSDRHIAQMLDGHLHKLLERALRLKENICFSDTTSPEEHFKKMVKLGHRLDTWGRYHLKNVSADERWERVNELFPLQKDGTPVPLEESFFEKKNRYYDYLLHSQVVMPLLRRCIEGMITDEEILSFGRESGIVKIGAVSNDAPTDAEVEAQDQYDSRRSSFMRRLLRYTFPEAVAYKYEKLTDGEDPTKILSIPTHWVVASNTLGGSGKGHVWDHVAVFLSGHPLLEDTREKIQRFSREGEMEKRRIPWFVRHLAENADILSLGPPTSASETDPVGGKPVPTTRASSRDTPPRTAPRGRDGPGHSDGSERRQLPTGGKGRSSMKGKSAGKKGGGKHEREDRGWYEERGWYHSSSSGWRWEDRDYQRGGWDYHR